MSAQYEILPPGGHETYATSIFSKIKTYLDSNPYGYLTTHQDISGKVSKAGDTMSGNLTAPKFIGALQGNADTATSATKATQDESGNNIKASYASSISISDHTITLKNKNGTSLGTVTVPDNDHYAWGDITGKPSTFTPSTHYHYELKTIGDQRKISTTPDTYKDRLIFQGLKTQSYIGNPGGTSGYSYLLGLRGWGDSSGGDAHELAFNNNGIYCRHGSTTTWGNWSKIFTSADTYTGTLTSSQVTTALGFTPTANTGTITSVKTTAGAHTTINVTSGAANFNIPTKTSHLTNDSGFVTTDTKNTAGSTDTSSKLFLIGATSQAANPQTYSQDTAYVGTDGCLYSGGSKVLTTEGDTISGDYVNTADFSEGGVYGKRVTTYGPWGIDVEEYLADSLWSRLSLRKSDILLTKTWDGTNTSLKSSITSLRNDKVNRSGDTISGDLGFAGGNVNLKTSGSSSDDSGDIAFYYGNGNEKCRIWTSNEYTAAAGPSYRVYKKDGTALYSGRLATMDDVKVTCMNTLGGSVLTAAKNAKQGVTFYYNSNQPTYRPTNCDWGSYIILRSNNLATIIYIDNSKFAVTYSLNLLTSETINWNIVK